MSPTYISSALIVVAQLLSFAGISVELDALNVTANTLITIVASCVVLYRRYQRGDVTALGLKK